MPIVVRTVETATSDGASGSHTHTVAAGGNRCMLLFFISPDNNNVVQNFPDFNGDDFTFVGAQNNDTSGKPRVAAKCSSNLGTEPSR